MGVTPWRLRAGLIKIRTSIKPGNPTFGKVLLSDQVGTTTPNSTKLHGPVTKSVTGFSRVCKPRWQAEQRRRAAASPSSCLQCMTEICPYLCSHLETICGTLRAHLRGSTMALAG